MVKIIEKVKTWKAENPGKPFIAFEYFPPRTEQGVANLYERIERMKAQDPLYIDFTWGAGGSTSDLTLELTVNSKEKYGLEPNMHLTCTNMPVALVDAGLEGAKKAGVNNILALRGDPPAGQEKWEATEGGFNCALDLVKHIRKSHGDYFGVSVAGYPEGHPSRISKVNGRQLSWAEKGRMVMFEGEEWVCSDEDYKIEMDYLKEKVDAGADFIVTQMFFDFDVFAKFSRDCLAWGINVPVMPGIMLLTNAAGFLRMTGFCKTRVPKAIADKIESIKDDEEAVKAYGITMGIELCEKLLAFGCEGLHFYTLNLEKTTFGIMEGLGLYKK